MLLVFVLTGGNRAFAQTGGRINIGKASGLKKNRAEKNACPSQGEEAVIDVLELKNMDIMDVFKLIADKSGLNIIAGKGVSGKVTIFLKDVRVKDALTTILTANDLAYHNENGILHVMTESEYKIRFGRAFGEEVEHRIVRLSFASLADVVKGLEKLKSPQGRIIEDSFFGTLVLEDSPQKIELMEQWLRGMDIPLETRIFELNYASVKDIGVKVEEILTEGVGVMRYDERSNKIIVRDRPDKCEDVSRIVTAFDVPEQQVLIEAKIVQVVLSDQHKFGVNWEAIISQYHDLSLSGRFDILKTASKKGTLNIGTLSSDDYSVFLEALEAVGETNILSSPSITSLNHQEAKILVGSTQPYVTTTTTTPSSGPTTVAESVNFIEVGVKLYVTPTIHKDDFVTMKIRPEVSSVTTSLITSNNNTIPVVESSEAETTVTVKDGVTIIIGGLIKDETIRTQNKVPLLGDIPLVGLAFRNSDDLKRKTEIIIFLTPRIISGDAEEDKSLDK